MKITTVLKLLTLALCLLQDADGEDENQETCSEFRELMKNGKLSCPQEKILFQTPDEIMFINKCVSCKVILEKEANSQKKAKIFARDTAPAKLNCDDFRRGDRNGDFICTLDHAAVCGTDGKTYSSRCVLCAENLKSRSQVDVKSEGACEATNTDEVGLKDVCSDFRPFVKDGKLGCTRENDPVLGPDGRTHGNKCAMCAELFLKEAQENTKRESEARTQRSAEEDLCKEYENQVKNGRLYCTRESDPIRGPDGQIHGNKCALCAQILKQRFIREKSKPDDNLRNDEEKDKVKREIQKVCSEYKQRIKDGKLFCTRENQPTRGPDGKMYSNECGMCEAFFKMQGLLRSKRQIENTEYFEKFCSEYKKQIIYGLLICTKEHEHTRGADGRMYQNPCYMCREFFKDHGLLRTKRQSENTASFEELCREYSNSRKNGQLICTRENDPIQGPDGKLHGNTCSMCAAFFEQQEKAKAKRETTEELCSEFRSQVRNGILICTRENDPVRGPDGKVHGNKCSMCASLFKLEEEAKKNDSKVEKEKVEAGKTKREAAQELCSDYRNYVRNGRLACTRENDPIEGPDGKIHGNTCSMCEAFFQQEEKEKKEAESRAKAKREAEKDTCSEFRSLLRNGNLFCTRENDPIRGPDGKTHGNKCAMCKAIFQKEDEERKRKEEDDQRITGGHGSSGGGGGKPQDQCAEFREHMNNGKLSCTKESDPVRDADGKSYNNKCTMCKDILQREAEEKQKHSGTATGKDECDEFRSQMRNGKLICTRESDPVRGPNGKTHGNQCAMCKEKLEREAADKKKNEDETRNTGDKSNDQCQEFRSMIREGKLICTRENDPVRGPDGKTHVNKCAMCQSIFEREANERKKNDLEKSNAMPTNNAKDECSDFHAYMRKGELVCTRENNPVRGADGIMYKNRCYMCRTIFLQAKEKSSHKRSSKEEDSSESSNPSLDSEMCKHYRIVPKMGYLCPKNLQPVCGDDGQTYSNPCMLCHENLIRQTNTHIRSEGQCEENSARKTAPLSMSASD